MEDYSVVDIEAQRKREQQKRMTEQKIKNDEKLDRLSKTFA